MSKYKIGDLVMVRSDLEINKKYGSIVCVPEMLRKAGKFVTIRSVASTGNYRVNESVYAFSDDMFIPSEAREMTITQIEKELGYSVKIVKE